MTTEYTTRQLETIRNRVIDIIEAIGEEFAGTYTGDNSFTEVEDKAIYTIIRGEIQSIADGIALADVENELNDAEYETKTEKLDEMRIALYDAGFNNDDIKLLMNV